MLSRNGEMSTPRACSWSCRASAPPKTKAPKVAFRGCQPAKITSATATKPRPTVTFSTQLRVYARTSCAPPTAASAPPVITAR
jgi:hypothetical protein